MSKLKNFFKKSLCAYKLGLAYVKAVGVLVKAAYQRWKGDGTYKVTFVKFGRKWYCEVPGFPKELFEHTLMVGGAANLIEYYSRGDSKIVAKIKIANEKEDKQYCGFRLYKDSSTLTGGAFYKDPSGFFNEEFWLCPVTLFLLGKYPERILIYKINKNHLHCPIYFE